MTPCIDDHALPIEYFQQKWLLAPVAALLLLKCISIARSCILDILWTVNTLACNATKWTVECDKRLHRLTSYMHHTSDYAMKSVLGDKPKDCKPMLFCDASFAADIEDSTSTSGGVLTLVGPHTFAVLAWLCKKQNVVSHSSREAGII